MAFLVAQLLLAASGAAAPPPLLGTTYVGQDADDVVRGVRIASDASLMVALSAYRTGADGKETWTSSQVLRLDKAGKNVTWKVSLPEELVALEIDASDHLYALGKYHLYKLAPKDGAPVGQPVDLGGDALDMALSPAGHIAVLVGGRAIVMSTDGLGQKVSVSHGIQTPASITLDREGGFFVGGDSNPGTGCEPYRVPQIYHFDNTGKRDWRFYDYPGALVRLMVQYQSDSAIIDLGTDPRGRLWFTGWSDGFNTVFTQKHWRLSERNPFLNEACYHETCRWPEGARRFTMVARLLDTHDEIGRATWWEATGENMRRSATKAPEGFRAWLEKQPICGCRDHGIAWPTSNLISGVRFHGQEAIIWGSSDPTPPTSPDAWFGRWVDGSVFVGILNDDVTAARFGAVIPATKGGSRRKPVADVRGGRLVIGGAAGMGLPTTEGSLQTAFGGGTSDGFLLLTCVDPAGCDGPMPALPAAAKPPTLRPQPPLPQLTKCDKATGTSTIASGSLPDLGIDYSQAPVKRDAAAMPIADAGAPTAPVSADAGTPTEPPMNAPVTVDASAPSPRPRVDAAVTGTPGQTPRPSVPSRGSGCATAGSVGLSAPLLLGGLALLVGGLRAGRRAGRRRPPR